jgi:hypothetical protein
MSQYEKIYGLKRINFIGVFQSTMQTMFHLFNNDLAEYFFLPNFKGPSVSQTCDPGECKTRFQIKSIALYLFYKITLLFARMILSLI